MQKVQRALCCQVFAAAALSWIVGGSAAAETGVDPVSIHLHENSVVARYPERSYFLSVARAGKRLVAVGERGIVIVSDDNGVSWKQVSTPADVTLTAVKFATGQDGWAVGHMGIILHTTDGGLQWSRQMDGVEAAKMALSTVEADVSAAGNPDDKTTKRKLRLAHQLVDDGPVKPFTDILAFDADTVTVVGAYNLVFSSEDGGKTWRYRSEVIDNPRQYHIYGAVKTETGLLFDGEQGLILASAPESNQVGMAMSRLKSPYEGSFFGALQIHGNRVLVYGMRGKMFVTDDAGQNWQAVSIPGDISINCAAIMGDGIVVVGDRSGRLLASEDQGATFHVVPSTGTTGINGLAEAEDGSMIMATDAGMTRLPHSVLTNALTEGSTK